MSTPVRFFCNHCNTMMKIGPQMLGKTIICPQCNEKVRVPLESNPNAEKLYHFMKRKRAAEKADGLSPTSRLKKPPSEPVPESLAPIPTDSKASWENHAEKPLREFADGAFEHLQVEEIDRWIKEFWSTVPEHDAEGQSPGTIRPSESQSAKRSESIDFAAWNKRQTTVFFRFLLLIMFLFGCIAGFLLHALLSDRREPGTPNDPALAADRRTITIHGDLSFLDEKGDRIPDADAVVFFLPRDRVPAFPIAARGLRANDPDYHPDGDGVLQLREIGGVFLRSDADGTFSAQLPRPGKYFVLAISSHGRRAESNETIPSNLVDELRRFFRNPVDLIGDYRFDRDEIDFDAGTYDIRRIFLP